MSAADLRITATADITPATKQVEKLTEELVDLGESAKVAAVGMDKINPATSKLTAGLAKTALATAKADGALDKIKGASNTAGQSLQNLGRIAQDAPFGFIGIQNNLNPLLESFQRLKAETGSTGSALKALGSSLLGAGGLGLALSLVSSAILLYQQYTQSSTSATKENEEAIKVSVSTYDKFLKELEQVSEAAGKEAAKVSILFSALNDSNIGLRERKGIIEQLNQLSPGYLGNLDKEKASYDEIAKAVFAYTESLAKSTEIKALLPQVDKLFQGLINAQIELNQLRRFQGGFFGLSEEDFKAEEKSFANQIKIAKVGLTNFAGGELNLSEILFGKTPELSKAKKEAETINDVLAKLARQIALLNEEQLNLGLDKSKEKISAINSAISELAIKFKVDPKDTIIQKLFGDIAQINFIAFGAELQKTINNLKLKTSVGILIDQEQAAKDISDQLGKANIKPIKIDLDTTEAYKKLVELAKRIDAINQQMAGDLKNTFNQALASIGESIGESLASGADFGKTVFGNLFKVLGAGLKQLGEAMIAIGTAKIALEKFKFAPGIGTVIAGIAAVALGSLLQKAIPGFAEGVQNFGGGLAVVGERGPELVRLPKGSDVIPNNQIGMMGGGSGLVARCVLQGKDMLVLIERAQQTNRRNG